MRTALAALGLVLLLPACFLSRDTVNEPLVPKKVAALKPGISTSQDVADALGAPTEVVQIGHGSAWRYDFTVRKRAAFSLIVISFLNEDARADRVWLFFDADNKLTHAGSTFEADDAEYAMPWQDVHD